MRRARARRSRSGSPGPEGEGEEEEGEERATTAAFLDDGDFDDNGARFARRALAAVDEPGAPPAGELAVATLLPAFGE